MMTNKLHEDDRCSRAVFVYWHKIAKLKVASKDG